MTTKVVPGMLVATQTPDEVAKEAAARIGKALREAIEKNGKASLALSGGETPRATYAALAKENVTWSKVTIYFVDERAVPPDSARSNFKLAKESLIDAAKIASVHRMKGEASDLDAAAREYEALLAGPIDVMVLGVGDDAHTASMFPGEPTIDVTDRRIVSVPAKGEREARLTMTSPVIVEARSVFVIAVGAKKTDALDRIWSVAGKKKDTPARIIREVRGAITWIIDKAAGGLG